MKRTIVLLAVLGIVAATGWWLWTQSQPVSLPAPLLVEIQPGTSVSAIAGQLVSVGMLGSDPAARLADARSAFAAGQLSQAIAEASGAAATWTTAASVGRTRIVSVGLLVLASLLFGRMLWLRRRRSAGPPLDPAA